MHTKWSPGWAFYKKEPVVKVTKVKDAKKIMDNCPDGIFSLKNNNLEINQNKLYDSQLLEHYARLDKGIEVSYTDNIIFYLEGWGQLTCKEILQECAHILTNKISEMEKLI